jgi:hypothetical protein
MDGPETAPAAKVGACNRGGIAKTVYRNRIEREGKKEQQLMERGH